MTFFDELERELTRAAQRLHRRRHRRVAALRVTAALVAVVGIVAGVVVVAGRHDRAVASVLEIDSDGVQATVTVTRADAPADLVVAELRDAGFAVQRVTRTSGPSRDGAVVGLAGQQATATPGPDGTLRLRTVAGSTITVLVGAHTGSGPYEVFTDAFAPGEPLHCIGWEGQPATALAAAATGLQLDFRTDDGQAVAGSELDGSVVHRAVASSATSVIVFVRTAPSEPRPPCG